MLILTSVAALVLLSVVVLLVVLLRRSIAKRTETDRELARLTERFRSVVDADAEAARVRSDAEADRAIEEIASAVREHHGEVELTLIAEAEEYRKTLALTEAEQTRLATPAVVLEPTPTL